MERQCISGHHLVIRLISNGKNRNVFYEICLGQRENIALNVRDAVHCSLHRLGIGKDVDYITGYQITSEALQIRGRDCQTHKPFWDFIGQSLPIGNVNTRKINHGGKKNRLLLDYNIRCCADCFVRVVKGKERLLCDRNCLCPQHGRRNLRICRNTFVCHNDFNHLNRSRSLQQFRIQLRLLNSLASEH